MPRIFNVSHTKSWVAERTSTARCQNCLCIRKYFPMLLRFQRQNRNMPPITWCISHGVLLFLLAMLFSVLVFVVFKANVPCIYTDSAHVTSFLLDFIRFFFSHSFFCLVFFLSWILRFLFIKIVQTHQFFVDFFFHPPVFRIHFVLFFSMTIKNVYFWYVRCVMELLSYWQRWWYEQERYKTMASMTQKCSEQLISRGEYIKYSLTYARTTQHCFKMSWVMMNGLMIGQMHWACTAILIKLNWQRRPTAMLNSGSHIVAKLRRVNQNERKHLIKFKTVAELLYQNMFICLGFG